LKWLGYVEICRQSFNIDEVGTKAMEVLNKILEMRAPQLRYNVTNFLFRLLQSQSLKNCLESQDFKGVFLGRHGPLFQLVLTPLLAQEEIPQVIDVLNSSYYEEAARAKIAVSSLLTLENTSLTREEKTHILKVVFFSSAIQSVQKEEEALQMKKAENAKLPTKEQRKGQSVLQTQSEKVNANRKKLCESINQNLQMMEVLINIHALEKLKKCRLPEDFEITLKDMFVEVTGIGEIAKFGEKYSKTVALFRQKEAIFVYTGNLHKLWNSSEKEKALASMKIFVEGVLNDNLSEYRYQETPGDHLSTVFKDRQDLKKLWMNGSSQKLDEIIFLEGPDSFEPVDVKKYLYQRVCLDKHIDPQKFSYLAACLEDSSQLEEKQKALEIAIESEVDPQERNRLLLEKGIFLLLADSKKDKSLTFASSIKYLIDVVFPDEHQFKQDLLDLENALSIKKPEKSLSLGKWTIVDTDNPEDLFICGTEVLGSCQSINSFGHNKCLLGYPLDGKNRLIAVKNESGEIVTRAIFRILWDKTNRTPVLLKERTYSRSGTAPRIEKALDEMFLQRAQTLNIPLVASKSGRPDLVAYPNTISSLSSKAPFEYVDAGSGATEGVYNLSSDSLEILWQPRN
jgi:hypothetical protein